MSTQRTIARKACIHKFNPPVPPAGNHTPRPPDPRPPKTQNEPNLPPLATPNAQKCKTNPIYHPGGPAEDQLCETNPIYPTTALSAICYLLLLTKRTQSHPRGTPIMRNEPNYAYNNPAHDRFIRHYSFVIIHPPPAKPETL